MNRVLIFFLLFFPGFTLFAQKISKVEIISANSLSFDKGIYGNITRFIGDCVFKQDDIYLYCDSAYLDNDLNMVDAFGNVKIKQGDSLTITSKTLNYEGNIKKAHFMDNVVVSDKTMVLTTEDLEYDAKTRVANYYGGGKLINKENVLTSLVGYYYVNSRDAYFKKKVILTNPQYVMNSDTLRYNTAARKTYFYGPTTIESEKDMLYCEDGEYNNNTNKARFSRRARYVTGAQSLSGDSLYYDRKNEIGKAVNNILFLDTINKMILKGNYALYTKKTETTYVTNKAFFVVVSSGDSLFLAADTLKTVFDTSTKVRDIFAFHDVRIFKSDLQGRCDSLVYLGKDSTMNFYKNPVIWANNAQLTADFISLFFKNKQADRLNMYNAAFVAFPEDSIQFNQIRGKNMTGYFVNNKLSKLLVDGNGQSIYFAKEDSGAYIGVNNAECSNMVLLFKENKVDRITFLNKPDASFSPLDEVNPRELKLKGFFWREAIRPKSKRDLFSAEMAIPKKVN